MLVAKGDYCALRVNKEFVLESALLASYSSLSTPFPSFFELMKQERSEHSVLVKMYENEEMNQT